MAGTLTDCTAEGSRGRVLASGSPVVLPDCWRTTRSASVAGVRASQGGRRIRHGAGTRGDVDVRAPLIHSLVPAVRQDEEVADPIDDPRERYRHRRRHPRAPREESDLPRNPDIERAYDLVPETGAGFR